MIDIGNKQIVSLDASELTPNKWNPNSVGIENMEKLKASLESNQFFKPVLYRELDDGTREIIGGEHRVLAAQELGIKVPALSLGNIDDETAKKLTLMDNDSYGENDSNQLANILKELEASGVDIVGEMTYTDDELESLLNLTTEVHSDVLDELDGLDLDSDDDPTESPDGQDAPEPEKAHYKTFKVKIDITQLEEFEQNMSALMQSRSIDDSDPAIERGQLFTQLVNEHDEEE